MNARLKQMRLNYRLLYPFMLVAEHGSFRRAAEELGITQSAVSMSIKQLEKQLGTSLFSRTSRHVSLTSVGESLFGCVRDAFSGIDESVTAIVEQVELQRGRVSLACATVIGDKLAPLLLALTKAFPASIIHARELGVSELLDALGAHEVDFAVGPRVKEETQFHFEHLFRDELCVFVPASHALARSPNVKLEDLHAALPMAIITRSVLQTLGERRLTSAQLGIERHITVRQVHTALSLVAAGFGAAISRRSSVPHGHGLDVLPVPFDPPVYIDYGIITLAGNIPSALALQFISAAKAALRSAETPALSRRSK